MEQAFATNILAGNVKAVPYKSVRNIPFFVSFLIYFSGIFIRMPPIPVGTVTVGLSEPFLILSLIIFALDRWDLNKMFNTPISNFYFFFLSYGIVFFLWSLRFYHTKFGLAFSGFRYIFLYPLALFIGYNYFSNIKHFKTYNLIIRALSISYIPLSVIYYVFKIGDRGVYLQYFDHTEAWVISFLLFYSLSLYFMKRKVSTSTKYFAILTVIIMVLTNRRGIWLSTLVSIFIVYYMSVARISFAYISRIIFRIGLVVAIIAAIFLLAPDNPVIKSVEDRVVQTISNVQDPTEFGQNSLAWRLIIWNTSINLFVQRPIFGWGQGYVQTVVFPKGPDNFHQVDDLGYHDIIMTFLVRNGVVGLILFLILHIMFMGIIVRNRNKFDAETRPYVCALFGFYTTTLIWSLFGNELNGDPNIIVLTYLAMGVMLRQVALSKYAIE